MSIVRALAVIPARGGSKRIPRKNIRPFAGRPILSWPVKAALDSGLFATVMVSTEDEEIAGIAREAGAETPFLRSAETADDHASLLDVLSEVVGRYAAQGQDFDAVCCILPTAILVSARALGRGYEMFATGDYDSVFPVAPFPAPIQRALRRDEAGIVSMFQPEHYQSRSQDLERGYYDAGQFYWMSGRACLDRVPTFAGRAGSFVLDETEVQDIDTEADWRLAELKHRLVHSGGS
ncbi:pseudaminic acid cytidylyltransferase [Brevundimonas sp. AJA228-03]|uniref:pseudaminic acid cytidylyltransferase n=1 Tax=Brevundimonas sp. AJA228-03 TaxID=2752515 RepID=UPI001AE02AA8|nr:pseudaminic acid cytidylyltransferase [Brevundimonas sp. AJA228-03]QTN20528.1 pseudaminic acid cytidylyltransferase [Brevundimonas sp. AJA228-03]